jgi:FkbM family methyltransferase
MLNAFEKLHMAHRCWRYRFKSEVPSIHFVRNADFKGKTLLDVGANHGIYSIYLSRAAGNDGRVVSFEAQPELGSHLRAVKESFQLANLTIENIGLSSTPGKRVLRRTRVGAGSASFHDSASPGLEEVEVQVVRLDDYLEDAGLGPIHFIKCDVEGHEWDVLKGGTSALRRDLPILLLECAHDIASAGEFFDFLCDLGYDGFFYHVDRRDHRSYLHKNRGHYVHYSEFSTHKYVRSGLRLRNYLFLKRGLAPESVHWPAGHPPQR